MRIKGFTLVELLVTIAVVAILLAVGLPSFQGALRSNRLATTTNEVIASASLARTEAIRTTLGSGICPTTDGGASCSGTWSEGWMVWADGGDADFGAFDADDDAVIRLLEPHPRMRVAVTQGGAAVDSVGFDGRGRPRGGAVAVDIRPDTCPAGQELVRVMTINLVGQVSTRRGTC